MASTGTPATTSRMHAPRARQRDSRLPRSHQRSKQFPIFSSQHEQRNRGFPQSPGFVFCSAYYMKMDAQYADVVVPVTTRWENDQAHLYVGTNMKDKENGFASRAPLPRHFESRPDREIAAELAVRLGLDYEALNPASDKQTWFDQISQTEIINFDGSGNSMRVAEVTQEDLDRYDVNGQPQPDSSPSSNTSKTASTASSAQPTING